MFSRWAILKPPSLLLRFCFETEEHTIQVTDLCRVWIVRLEKSHVLRQAEDEDCSIDPSQDDEQYDILMQKLHSSLRDQVNLGCSVSGDNALLLTTECALPYPLRPLHWTWRLELMGPSGVQSQFIMPLIASNYIQAKKVDELCRLMVEKDNALANLLDKIESTGLDLTNAFPQTASVRSAKRMNKKEQLLQQVKGLRPFRPREWLETFDFSPQHLISEQSFYKSALLDTADSRVSNVLASVSLLSHHMVAAKPKPGADDGSKPRIDKDVDAGDEFQRQPTPENLQPKFAESDKTSRKLQKRAGHSNRLLNMDSSEETTEDESTKLTHFQKSQDGNEKSQILDSQNDSKPELDPGQSPTKPCGPRLAKKLGKIRGRAAPGRDSEENESNSDATWNISHKARPAAGTLSASPLPADQSARSVPTFPARKKTGIIGGRGTTEDSKNLEAPTQTAELRSDSGPPKDAYKPKKERGKLGRIGGRKSGTVDGDIGNVSKSEKRRFEVGEGEEPLNVPQLDAELENLEGEPAPDVNHEVSIDAADGASSLQRRSSQDKADKKREELKRQLDAKGRTQSKKKRKF